ncbi:MAG: Fe-Mn family superoxide dismutase [Myxococcota bacterium]
MVPTRRTLLRTGSAATLGLAMPGCVAATRGTPATNPPAPASSPMTPYAPQPLPFDPAHVPGLSEALLRSHHDNNYVGAVKKLNAARARLADVSSQTPGFVLHGLSQAELAFKHSVVLHELYFGNLVGGGAPATATQTLLSEHFGGAAAWEERFAALGASLGGGSGWAVVEYDLHQRMPRMYSAADHTQGLSSGVPLLVLDMYEHSYHMDYGTAAKKYIAAFFANLNWQEVDRRTELALQIAAAPV